MDNKRMSQNFAGSGINCIKLYLAAGGLWK